MGPREVPPPLPDIEANLPAKGRTQISVLHRPCNWMQGWEGEMDTVHAAFLHGGAEQRRGLRARQPSTTTSTASAPPSSSPWRPSTALANGAYRPAEADTYYWRVTQILLPFYNMIPTRHAGRGRPHRHLRADGRRPPPALGDLQPRPGRRGVARATRPLASRVGSHPIPNGTGWYERFRVDQNLANDYLIDRERSRQRGTSGYTGIAGVRLQDCAVTETMGPIYDRSHEHLGTTDPFIIRTRRRMIMLAQGAGEQGMTPPGVDNPEVYRQRSGEMILPRTQDWWSAYQQIHQRVTRAEAPIPTNLSRR